MKKIKKEQNKDKVKEEAVTDKKNLTKKEESARIKKSLKYAVYDGSAYSVMAGFGDNYLSPFAIALGANTTQIGLLNSVPNLLASILQLWTPKIADKFKSRKKIVCNFVFLQALMWLFLLAVPFLLLGVESAIYILIFFAVLKMIFGTINSPVWGSWISDLVPEKNRGTFFGKRNKIVGFVLLGATFIAGTFLNLFPKELIFYGFAILFLVAFIFRIISMHYLGKMHEPEQKIDGGEYFSFIDFIKRLPASNFAKFTLYVSLITFAVYISGPFFALYMLRDLKFSYFQYSLLSVSATFTSLLIMPLWGKVSDKVGNIRILRLNGFLLPIIPLLWLVSGNFFYLMFVEAFSGLVWAGFNLCVFNFICDAVSPQKRVLGFSYFNVLSGIALFIGASFGSFLAKVITGPFIFISGLPILFLISGLARFIVSLVMLPMIKEVKPVSDGRLLAVFGSNLRGGILYHWIEGFMHVEETLEYGMGQVKNGVKKFIKNGFRK